MLTLLLTSILTQLSVRYFEGHNFKVVDQLHVYIKYELMIFVSLFWQKLSENSSSFSAERPTLISRPYCLLSAFDKVIIMKTIFVDNEKGKTAWTHNSALGRTEMYFTTSPKYPESEYKSETYHSHNSYNGYNSITGRKF